LDTSRLNNFTSGAMDSPQDRKLLRQEVDEAGESETQSNSLSPIGEMKGLPALLGPMGWIDISLRGAGQVVFMNNPISGLIIIIALAIFDWRCALFGVLSLLAGTFTAMILHSRGAEGFASHTDGLYGFNAILVGLGIATFCEDAHSDEAMLITQTAVMCVVFGILSSLVMNSLAKWMPTPAFTLPFNICIMWFFGGTLAYTHMTTDISPRLAVKPDDVNTCIRSLPKGDCDMHNLAGFAVAALQGVCEIFLAGSNVSAVLILVGMAICSPLAAFCCLLGSTVGVWTGLLVGVDGNMLYKGLYGFNPALTLTAIGGGIFAPPSLGALVWGVFGAGVTVFLQGTLSGILAPAGLPAFTLPFCIAAVFHIGVGVHK